MTIYKPVKPSVHSQVKLAIPSIQTPLFIQGELSHSFMLVVQPSPVKPSGHLHSYSLTRSWHTLPSVQTTSKQSSILVWQVIPSNPKNYKGIISDFCINICLFLEKITKYNKILVKTYLKCIHKNILVNLMWFHMLLH